MKKIAQLISVSFITLSILLTMNNISYCANMGTITTKEVRLRKTADQTATVLELINTNEQVEILEKSGDWYKVKYNKITGYVHSDYIKVNEENTNSNSDDKEEKDTNENIDPVPTQEETIQIGNTLKANCDTNVYIRPLISSDVIIIAKQNQEVQIIQILNGWTYISVNGVNGWIRQDKLVKNKLKSSKPVDLPSNVEDNKSETNADKQEKNNLNKTGYVKTDGINFRADKDTSSKILKVLAQNAKLTIISEDGDWYKATFKEETGYILKMYVSERKVETTSRGTENRTEKTKSKDVENTQTTNQSTNTTSSSTTTSSSSSVSKGQQVADYVKTFLGCKYVYGGASPTKGFDCSGLTMYVYKKFGINLSHSATAQSKVGTKVDKSDLQVGDLVFFSDYKTYTGIGHCGIYIGNNKFVHASTEKTGVITSSLTSGSYVKRYVTATRLF